MSELLMFIGLSIFMIVLFILFVIGATVFLPFILLIVIFSSVIVGFDKLKKRFSRKQ